MADSVGVQREPREVIAEEIRVSQDDGVADFPDLLAGNILAALADAGYSVVETVRGSDPDSPFRRVEGGATGEQTE